MITYFLLLKSKQQNSKMVMTMVTQETLTGKLISD
jgi:hypothetical protein